MSPPNRGDISAAKVGRLQFDRFFVCETDKVNRAPSSSPSFVKVLTSVALKRGQRFDGRGLGRASAPSTTAARRQGALFGVSKQLTG